MLIITSWSALDQLQKCCGLSGLQEHKTHSSAFFHQTKFLQGTYLHASAPTVSLYLKQEIPKGKPHFKEAEQGEMKHRCCCRARVH